MRRRRVLGFERMYNTQQLLFSLPRVDVWERAAHVGSLPPDS